MKKSKLVVAALLVACLGVVGCGSETATQGNNTTVESQQTPVNNQQGYVFENSGAQIAINGDINEIISKIGEPQKGTFQATSCAFDGLDKFWYYDGFTIQGYQVNNKDLVYSISFMDDTVKTKEGIRIGDSKDKVTKAYGQPSSQDGSFVYESGDTVLTITVANDSVSNIVYSLK